MKNKLLTLALATMVILSSCNSIKKAEPKDILKKSFNKCQSVKNGYYEMDYYVKYMSGKDTLLQTYKCYFNKLKGDSIFSSAFHYQKFSKNEYENDVLYTGDDFVNYSKKDSTGEIMSKKLWAKKIKAISHNFTFYSPLTSKESLPLPKDSAFIDPKNTFKYLGEETVNNIPCYHIQWNTIPENDEADRMKMFRAESHFWINKQDYIPIQYTTAYDFVMDNDTMSQYEKNILTKYELNKLKDTTELQLSSIPPYIKLQNYKPHKSPELLAKGTNAPNWSLTDLNDKTHQLTDYKGQVVLIDFFYKSCYPCMLALPALEDLHKKYGNKGLKIVGIDPFDTKEKDDIDRFLAKHDVTYTVLLGGDKVAREYHVSGYPTIYLIDKEGKIIFSMVGYGEGVEKELEKIIKKHL